MLTAPVILDRFLNLRFHRIIQSYPGKEPWEIFYSIPLIWGVLPHISQRISGSVFSTPPSLLFKANHTAPWFLLTGCFSQPFAVLLAQLWAQTTSPYLLPEAQTPAADTVSKLRPQQHLVRGYIWEDQYQCCEKLEWRGPPGDCYCPFPSSECLSRGMWPTSGTHKMPTNLISI